MAVHDWLPTLYSAAGGEAAALGNIGRVDMWAALAGDTESPRNILLHNIDSQRMISALRVGDYKLLKGSNYAGRWNSWYGPSGRGGDSPEYDIAAVRSSPAAAALQAAGAALPSDAEILKLRGAAEVRCPQLQVAESCEPSWQVCLFNVREDPCEQNNLVFRLPSVVQVSSTVLYCTVLYCAPSPGTMIQMLEETWRLFNSTAVPPRNRPIDPRADPKYTYLYYLHYLDIYTAACQVLRLRLDQLVRLRGGRLPGHVGLQPRGHAPRGVGAGDTAPRGQQGSQPRPQAVTSNNTQNIFF